MKSPKDMEKEFARLEAELDATPTEADRARWLQAVRGLRKFLSESESNLALAVRAMSDPNRNRRIRETLLVVLGSLPGSHAKECIAKALNEGALLGLERVAVLCLGILELEDDHQFERDGLPYAVEVSPGLIVYVRGEIVDPSAREAISRLLAGSSDPRTRRAAALALRDSVSQSDARQIMSRRFGVEDDPETRAEMGASLAGWARRASREDPERAGVVGGLLAKLQEGDEILRFRLLSPLASVSLRPEEADRVRGMIEATDADVRKFAIDLLGHKLAGRTGVDAQVIPSIVGVLAGDPSVQVRSSAAFSLGNAVGDPRAVSALVKSMRSDPDWEVRAAGARALGSHGDAEATDALRVVASSDPRAEVRAAATRSLAHRPK